MKSGNGARRMIQGKPGSRWRRRGCKERCGEEADNGVHLYTCKTCLAVSMRSTMRKRTGHTSRYVVSIA